MTYHNMNGVLKHRESQVMDSRTFDKFYRRRGGGSVKTAVRDWMTLNAGNPWAEFAWKDWVKVNGHLFRKG